MSSLRLPGCHVPNLSQLRLSGSVVPCVRDLGTSLGHLTVLWMPRCKLRDLDGLPALASLKELYLAFNEISDVCLVSMLSSLEVLDVERWVGTPGVLEVPIIHAFIVHIVYTYMYIQATYQTVHVHVCRTVFPLWLLSHLCKTDTGINVTTHFFLAAMSLVTWTSWVISPSAPPSLCSLWRGTPSAHSSLNSRYSSTHAVSVFVHVLCSTYMCVF